MKRRILLEWPTATESPEEDSVYTKYRLVGTEPEPGTFEYLMEGLRKDAMGAASWVGIRAASPPDKVAFMRDVDALDTAIGELSWHLWKHPIKKEKK
jgi:hypothetical protein